MQWKNIYVFISSTFNDMHSERDYLVKNVFPELYEWCEERKLRLVDIDLRWGVTSADSQAKNTVLACLKNIDECRPFFLCFLGQRRGWVPGFDEISESTRQEYPGLEPYIGQNSVTEMEIEHALLSPMLHIVSGKTENPIPVRHALFYFRNDRYRDSLSSAQKKIYTNTAEEDEKAADMELEKFKERIKAGWPSVFEYDCFFDRTIITTELITEGAEAAQGRLTGFCINEKPLKDIIIDCLKAEIEKEFPDRQVTAPQSVFEQDLEQQEQFIEQIREGFIHRDGDYALLDEYINSNDRKLFLLTAPAGMGKTMLLADFTHNIQNEGRKIYARFCGASDLASDVYNLWKSILNEAKIDCPPTLDKLQHNVGKIMEALASKGPCIVLMDAVDQLANGPDMLSWLPHALPEKIKLIISFKEDDSSFSLIQKLKTDSGLIIASVCPFADKKDKQNLVNAYLEKYLKSLDDELLESICEFEASENPLYLKILLSELRVFGSFKRLDEEIKKFGKTPKEAFINVLERLEKDPSYSAIPPNLAVPYLFGLLSSSRKGLSEKELTFCFKKEFPGSSEEEIKSTIRLFLRQLRPFLARREGRSDFLYESFKLAAVEKYLPNSIELNLRLAQYFKSGVDVNGNFKFEGQSPRDFDELPYHMHKANEKEMLEKMLCDYLWIYNKIRLCGINPAISDYDYTGGDDTVYHLKMLRGCLRLSANILHSDYEQLPSQLYGRLADEKNGILRRLLEQASEVKRERSEVWLRPKNAFMDKPGSNLKQIYKTQVLCEPALSPDRKNLFICRAGSQSMSVIEILTGKQINSLPVPRAGKIIFSEDGNDMIYYLHRGIDIFVYNLPSQKISILTGLTGEIKRVISMGKVLVATSYDKQLAIWKRQEDNWEKVSGNIVFEGNALALVQNGEKLLAGASDGTITIWNTGNAECLTKFKPHLTSISHILPSDSGINFYTIAESLRVFSLETQEQIDILANIPSPVMTAKLSGRGKYIAYTERANVCVIDVMSKLKKELKRYDKVKGYGNSLIFTADEKRLFIGCEDYSIKEYNLETGKLVSQLTGHADAVTRTELSDDEKSLMTYSNDATARIWDLGALKSTSAAGDKSIKSICRCKNKNSVLAGTDTKRVNIYDFSTTKKTGEIPVSGTYCWSITAPESGNYVCLCSRSMTEVIDLRTSRPLFEAASEIFRKEGKKSVNEIFGMYHSIYLESKGYVVFTDAGTIFVYDAGTADIIKVIPAHTRTITHISAFNEDKKLLTVGSGNEIKDVDFDINEAPVKIWDIETGKCIKEFGDRWDIQKPDSLRIINAQLGEERIDGIILYTHTGNGEFKAWKIQEEAKQIKCFVLPGITWLSMFSVCENSNLVVYSSGDRNNLSVLEIDTQKIIARLASDVKFEQIEYNTGGQDIASNCSGELAFFHLENYENK